MNEDVEILKAALVKSPEAQYLEKGTFQGGEEDCFKAGIQYADTDCRVLKAEDFNRIARLIDYIEKMQAEWQADVRRGLEMKEQIKAYEGALKILGRYHGGDGSITREMACEQFSVLSKYKGGAG